MAAPELRLNVTLDLAAFRAQLTLLAIEAGAHNFGVKLSIDETDFKKQLKNLEKIEPVLKINDAQIIAAKDRVQTLNSRLSALRKATATPIEIKVKYVEVGKPPSGASEQIGRAVSGGVRGSQAIEGFTRPQLQNTRKAMLAAGMSVGEMGNLAKASTDDFKKSIIPAFTNSAQEAVNGFAAGLKNASSKIAQAAANIGEEGVRGIKDALGIASPSKVFQQIGEFSVDGLEIGFLNGLKSFKSKVTAEIRAIVAPLKLEFAKIQDISGAGVGPTVGSLRQQLVGNRMYSAPIGPLPLGSEAPYARGDRGQFGYTGYEPRMVSRLRGQAPTAEPNSFLQFSRNAAQIQPPSEISTGFRGFSQRAAQVQQGIGGGGGSALPAAIDTSATVGNIKSLMSAINDLGGKAAGAASQIKSKASRALREVGDFISGEGRYDGGYGGGRIPPKSGGGPFPGGGGNPPIPPRGTEQTINFETNASEISQEIKRVQDAIVKTVRASKTSLKLTLDTSKLDSGIDTSFKKLDKEIAKAQKQLNKLQIGGADFNAQAEVLGFKEGQRERGENISNAIRLKAQAGAFEPGSLMRDQKVLEAMRIEAAQIRPATKEWISLQQQIAQANLELQKTDQLAENIQLTQTLGALEPSSLAGLETKLTILRNKARDIKPDSKEWKALNKEIQDIEGNIAKATKRRMGGKERLGAAGGAFLYGGGLSGGAGSAIGGIGGGLIGGVPGAFTGAAIGQAVDDLGKMTAAMTEQATVIKKLKLGLASASNDFGDFAAANQEVERISNSLLIPLEDVYRKFTQLRASTVALGIDTKTTGEIFEGTAAAVLKSGGSMDDVSGAMRAVVQVFSKGKLTAEELRGQLAERLPGAVVEFAESAGMSVQQLDKEFEAGTTTLDDFVKFLRKKSKESADFTKEMAVGSEYAGRRMEKAFEKVQISIGQAFQPTGAAFQDFSTGVLRFLDSAIAKAIELKLLQPGKDFYIAEAMASGEAGIANLENKLLDAMQNQKQLGKNLDDAGIGFMKNIDMEYTKATKQLNIYQEALKDVRKLEKLTKQREEQERQQLLDEKLASGVLNAIEQREESLGKARENYEENIANIRENAVKQAQDLEKKYQDQRLQAERTLAKIRRDLAASQEDLGFITRQQEAGFTGEDPEVINAEKRGAEIIRTYTEEKIRIEEESQDRQIALSKELENFKRTNADAINQANERYAKSIGEIQRAYAKSVAKLIEEGSKNGAKQLVAAGKLINELTKQSIAQKAISSKVRGGVEPLGVDQYKVGEIIYSAKGILDEAKIAEQTNNPTLKGLYQLVLQLVQATNNIAQAEKALASSLSAATSASPVITSTVNTRDLDQRVESSQNKLKQTGKQIDSSSNALNKQENVLKQLREEFAAESKDSRDALIANRKQNNLLVERLKLIRNGVLPALAEEKAERDAMDNLESAKIAGLKRSAMAKNKEPEIQQLITEEFERQTKAIQNQKIERDKLLQQSKDNLALVEAATIKSEASFAGAGLKAGYTGEAGAAYRQKLMEGVSPDVAAGVANATNQLKINRETVEAIETSILSLGASFSSVFKGMVNQTMTNQEALDTLQQGFASFFRSIGDYFLDMVLRMIADAAKLAIVKGLQNIFSMFGPKLPGAPAEEFPAPKLGPGYANGGIVFGGFTAFASGGIVQGPTLGLVGEGRYNEAIIPLPDGKSVPVQLAGGSEGTSAPINTNIVVNVKNGQSDSQVTGNQGNQLGREIEGAVRQVILKEIRPGGIIYGSR